jgi:molybdate transport system regulatory protein
MKLSARNIFTGTVASIKKGAVNAEISLSLKGGAVIVATITIGSVESLGLSVGKEATAIVKASTVIIGTDLHNAKVSARNVMCGKIVKIIEGPVNAEVDVEIGADNTMTAVITRESAKRLELKEGGHACTMFKASSVIIGVN